MGLHLYTATKVIVFLNIANGLNHSCEGFMDRARHQDTEQQREENNPRRQTNHLLLRLLNGSNRVIGGFDTGLAQVAIQTRDAIGHVGFAGFNIPQKTFVLKH